VPLFIDRLPFRCWTDFTRSPPFSHWTVVLPIVIAEPMLPNPPSVTTATDWLLDTGNRGEAFAWRHHLTPAGLDADQGRMPLPLIIRTVAGGLTVPVRDADLWLVSNIPAVRSTPYRMVLHRGLPFQVRVITIIDNDLITIIDARFRRGSIVPFPFCGWGTERYSPILSRDDANQQTCGRSGQPARATPAPRLIARS
jgi:hypothetical protein